MHESLTRNYHTRALGDKPYSLADNTDIDADVYITPQGKWMAKVKCLSRPELSTPLRTFTDQISADHWAQKNIERITRATMNENLLRHYVSTIIKEIL
tara:strand:- start:740 stop:1033 length:294 start_codon:yes stop_codon:yes gene_type:complete